MHAAQVTPKKTLEDTDKSTIKVDFPAFKVINRTWYKISFVYGVKDIVIP